ncbi:RNA polymerase sigma-70 factor (ECF subfamily) [Flavobacteriaceae bacterium MAR_2010_105]|nr:RNA polymerase sigma-70 factor (ECF subfamily) [Flavobacteriaceae bacterium MAR_2010_105]
MTSNDQIIINQIIDGNTNAFAVLVDRYKDLVFTLALRMMKHREEAEEVAQDTFIKVFKSLNKFKGDSKFSTWIYKVAYNSCLDKIKGNKRKYNEVEINNHTSNYIKTSNNAFDDLVEEERKQAIQECLNQLPSDDSFLLTLFFFEEQSLEEISSIIGLTSNNVKVKLFRARKKLAGILKERIEPELIEYYEKEHK